MKNIKTYFIDLDGTVYDKNNGMWEELSTRIGHYMQEVMGIPEEQVIPLREKYYRQYGSSLVGLQLNHNVDSEDYLAFVHDIDLTKYLAPDPDLRRILESIPQPKWILTNSDRNHSKRVLKALELEGIFEGILDVWSMDYIPKPDPRVYRRALQIAGDPRPDECIFIDDTLKNLGTAHDMGINTVWVDSFTPHPDADLSIPHLHNLPIEFEPIPALFYAFPDVLPELRLKQSSVSAVYP